MNNTMPQRDHFDLRDEFVLSDFPLHVAGSALFVRNENPEAVTLEVQESDDGTGFGLVMLSTPAMSGLSSITIEGKAMAVVLFASVGKYIKVKLTAAVPETVDCHLVQYDPTGRAGITGSY